MIFVRPGARELIQHTAKSHKVAVWTAAYGDYLSEIISQLFEGTELEFIWDRTHCSVHESANGTVFQKELKKLHRAGWAEGDFLILDDKPEEFIGKTAGVIVLKPYYGGADDRELYRLMQAA